MARLELPEQAYLLQRLDYCPETGILTWKQWHAPPNFNSRFAGKEAFTTVERGYRQGRIDNRLLYAHRVIWRMMTGETPHDIDHINGDRGDNRWVNLRAVTRQENLRNKMLSPRNKTGTPGVSQAHWGAWQAYIRTGGRNLCLGSFKTKPEAVAARKAAERVLGYHPNHGRS